MFLKFDSPADIIVAVKLWVCVSVDSNIQRIHNKLQHLT